MKAERTGDNKETHIVKDANTYNLNILALQETHLQSDTWHNKEP